MATPLAARLPVVGPARVPAPYGLFSVLQFRDSFDRHWEAGGVQWQSLDGTVNLGVVGAPQADPADTSGLPKTFARKGQTDEAGVFTLYGQQKVTPGPGWNQESASERARDLLTMLEERTVEMVLAGAIGDLAPSFSSATVVGASLDLVEVIADLENFLGDNYGSRGVIHLSRDNAIRGLSTSAVLETRGNGLFTKLGTPVVAGSGYPSDAAYATSALVGYRSEVFDNVGQPYDPLDKSTNDLFAIAERTYSIGFEAKALALVTIGDSPA